MRNAEGGKEVVAERLRMAREMAGLSQSQVAKKLGMHRPSISEMEAGRRSVTANELVDLAEMYGVTIAWLTGTDKHAAGDPRVELAARELARLKPKDVERLLRVLATMREEGENK